MDILRPDLEEIDGWRTTGTASGTSYAPDTTSDEYAKGQEENNRRVAQEFLAPLCERLGAGTVVDVGCGVGTSVMALVEAGIDAYGVDLEPLVPHWTRLGCPRDRFFVISADDLHLPFRDDSIDFMYSLGAIEHVGTTDGHSTRRDDYEARRRQWVHELYRTVAPGGSILLGGPNRGFPLDFSHGLDGEASPFEQRVSSMVGVSVHRTWGRNFLWGYRDVRDYLEGLDAEWSPMRIGDLLQYGRVPGPARRLTKAFIDHLPERLLGTGFNPWTLALIRKPESSPTG